MSGYLVTHTFSARVIAIALVVAVGFACSTNKPPRGTNASDTGIELQQNKLIASASVLITESQEDPIIPIDSIRINPEIVVVDPGEYINLSAQAFGSNDEILDDVKFVWSTTDPRAGTVSPDGKYRAGLRPGKFGNSISVTGLQNTTQGVRFTNAFASIYIVGEDPSIQLGSVTIIPESPTLYGKQIFRLRAVAFDKNGMVIPGAEFVWNLNESTLGEINNLGLLTVKATEGRFENAVSVTAIWEGVQVSASSDVRVATTPKADNFLAVHALPQRFFVDPGDRLQLRAVALNGLGELVAGTEIRWTMAESAAGSIDGNGNFIAGPKPGIYTRSVKVEAMLTGEKGFVRAKDFASVVIREEEASRKLYAIDVPRTLRIGRGESLVLAATGVDETGKIVKNVKLSWQVVTDGIGEINNIGTFKTSDIPGRHPNALQVTATQSIGNELITKSQPVNVVTFGTLTKAEVQPSMATISPGKVTHFYIRGWDENDYTLPGLVVLWSLSDDRAGTIDPFGNFTASGTPGLYQDLVRAEIIQTLR